MLLRKSIHNPSCFKLSSICSFVSWKPPQRTVQILTPIEPVVLSNINDNFGARTPCKRVGRGDGSGHGNSCGRGNGGQNKRSGNKSPYPGFEGGQTPLMKRLPKFHGPDIRRQEFAIVTLEKLQRWIDVGRIRTDIPITMKEMWESGLVGRVKDGILIDHKGAPYLRSPVHVEAARFTKEAIDAIETVGGKAIAVYFNKLCLRALLKPQKFRIFPRRPEPVDTRDIDYYCDYENRGYIAMRVQPTYPSLTSVFYGGRKTPIQYTEPELAPLKPTVKLLALREQWEKEDASKETIELPNKVE